jgi:signal transduction histidine kinase/ActR/RegA family two-component response regulator
MLDQAPRSADTDAVGVRAWLSPELRAQGIEIEYRALLFLAIAGLLGAVGAAFSAYFLTHGLHTNAAPMLLMALLSGSLALSLRWARGLSWPGHILVGGHLLVVCALNFQNGGFGLAPYFGCGFLPALALLFCGLRAGLGWFFATLVQLLAVVALNAWGVVFPAPIPAEQWVGAQAIGGLAMLGLIFGLTYVFESLRARSWAEAERAWRQAGAAMGELEDAWMQAEAALDQAEAARRSQSEFLASISHEIRTPMNGVIGMLEMLGTVGLPPEAARYTEVARDSANSMVSLLNDLLDLSKAEAGAIELEQIPFELTRVLDGVRMLFQPAAQDKGVRLLVDRSEDWPDVLVGDPQRLRQVLSNLVSNAVKFTDEGAVIIRAEGEVRGRQLDLWIQVEDSGIGISAEAAERVFEKFSQASSNTSRKYGGTGLGLAICKQLTELMGGTITLTSEPGRGSTFAVHLTLPVANAPLEEAPGRPELDAGGALALVVDDHPSNTIVLGAMLKHLNFDVVCVRSGREALSESALRRFEMVFLDCQMPEMDGFEVSRALHTQRPLGAPTIIAVTGDDSKQARARCQAAGMHGFLTKPVTREDLWEVTSQWLKEREIAA